MLQAVYHEACLQANQTGFDDQEVCGGLYIGSSQRAVDLAAFLTCRMDDRLGSSLSHSHQDPLRHL